MLRGRDAARRVMLSLVWTPSPGHSPSPAQSPSAGRFHRRCTGSPIVGTNEEKKVLSRVNIAETSHWLDLLLPTPDSEDGLPGAVYRTHGDLTCRVYNLGAQLAYATCNYSRGGTGMLTTAAALGLDGDPAREFDCAVEIITVAHTAGADVLDAVCASLATPREPMPQPGVVYTDLAEGLHGLFIMPYLWEEGAPRVVQEAAELGRPAGQPGLVTLLVQLLLLTGEEVDILSTRGMDALQEELLARGTDLNDVHREGMHREGVHRDGIHHEGTHHEAHTPHTRGEL